MSASGKSSNRRSEYARGYSGAGGHGIYAEAGKADRRATERVREPKDKPCPECGHLHTPTGCTGPATASDRCAGVTPAACDCVPEPG